MNQKFRGVLVILLAILAFTSVAMAQTRWDDTTKNGWYLSDRPLERNLFSGPLKLESPLYAEAGFNIFLPGTDGHPTNAVAAYEVLTITGTTADTQTVTVGSTVYEFDTNDTITDGRVQVDISGGNSIDASLEALHYVLEGDFNSVIDLDANTFTVTTTVPGVIGNTITIGETLTNGSWDSDAVLLSNGEDGTIGEAGETIFVNGRLFYTAVANTIAGQNWKTVELHSYPSDNVVDWTFTRDEIELSITGPITIEGGNSMMVLSDDLTLTSDKIVAEGEVQFKPVTGAPACAAGNEGTVVYNTTGNFLCFCNGTVFKKTVDDTTNCF